MSIFDIISEYGPAFWDGLWVTFKLCLLIWSIGIILGTSFAILAYRIVVPFYYIFSTLTLIIIAIPVLVILYWLHFPFQRLLDVVIDPFYTTAFTLSILNVFLIYQIIVTALRDFPKEYIIVGKVSGLSNIDILKSIQIPLILRKIIPSILTLQIFMLQSSIFGSLISVEEIFRKAQRINSVIQKPVEIYTVMALFFILICLPLYFLAYYLNKRFSRDLSES